MERSCDDRYQTRQSAPVSPPKSKILFALYSWFYFKNLSSVIEHLAREGHEVTVAAIRHDREDFYAGVSALADRYPNITVASAPKRRDSWLYLTWDLRQSASYIHFLDPRFDKAFWLRDRPRRRAPELIQALMRFKATRWRPARRLIARVIERLEKALPTDPGVDRFLADQAPDVVVLSPLIDLDARLWDCLKSALARGLPSVFAVHSWDNLSSKMRLIYHPHRVLVWNENQVDEAIRYHDVPRDLIAITGAQVFDEWFERRPSASRDAFCARLGFDPQRPILLYVCSALSPNLLPEPDYVHRWLDAIRSAGEDAVAGANILIRPHPKRHRFWEGASFEGLGRVAIDPQIGELPVVSGAKDLYYDALYHCSLVIGINTSALIEAGIVGRPVLTILEPDYYQDQMENFHFSYLLEVSGGLLIAANSLEQHVEQVGDCLRDRAAGEAKARAFVEAFVRPQGMAQPATELFAREVLDVAAEGRRSPARTRLLDHVVRVALWPWSIAPEFVKAEVIDSVKMPKREAKHLRKAQLARAIGGVFSLAANRRRWLHVRIWASKRLISLERTIGELFRRRLRLRSRTQAVVKQERRFRKRTKAAIRKRLPGPLLALWSNRTHD